MKTQGEMVRLKSPTGGGVGIDGKEYESDEKGVVTVPASAADQLKIMHGFIDAPFDDSDEVVGDYAIKHQGHGLWKIMKGNEEIEKGLSKPDAEAKVAELTTPKKAE